MEVRFFLCAESAVIDSASNKITILNVIEELSAASFPGVLPLLTIVALFVRKKSEADKPAMKIVGSQNNKELFDIPISPPFQGKLRTRLVIGLQGIVLPGPGNITVSLNHKNKTIASWPIDVLDFRSSPMATMAKPIVASTTSAPTSTNATRRRRHR
jgi:hypothetical protein